MTNFEQKKSPSSEKGKNQIKQIPSSLPFVFSKIKKNGEILTKKVSLTEGKLISDGSECRLTRGFAEKIELTLEQFPEFLKRLQPNEAIVTGLVSDNLNNHEIVPKEKFISMGGEFPSKQFDHGLYATRTKDSFSQSGRSLVMFDYDYDDSSRIKIDSPEQFITFLAKVIPNFENISYVRTFSTSSAIYDKASGKCLRPAEGFHLYMIIEDGADLEDFGKRLNQRLWLEGYGHVKVSKSAALLPRTVVDIAVFSPERLIFEAGAVVEKGLEQRLPAPHYVKRDFPSLDTKTVKRLTAQEEQQRLIQEKRVKTSESVLTAQSEVRKTLVLNLISKSKGEGKKITVRQAEKIVEAKMQYRLTYDTEIEFENGTVISVAELLANPDPYDKMPCIDPLREDKGFGKSLFYANSSTGNPVINSFIEGGRIYKLADSIVVEDEALPEVWVEQFREQADDIDIQNNRYLKLDSVREGLTLIRSGKGTGKTFGLAEWLKDNPELRVLNITHRVSLARALGTRFEMDIYNDEDMTQTKLAGSQRLSCCYDSIYKLSQQYYDVVVMDEAVQVMRHMVADTVKEKFLCLNILLNIIYNAKYIVMMDADLQTFHVEFLKTIALILPSTKINALCNTYLPAKGKTIEILEDSDGKADELTLLQRMAEAADRGGFFYASNSVKDVESKAEQVIRELGYKQSVTKGDFIIEIGEQRVIIISGNNSGNSEVQEFIDNINGELRDTDLLFCSPSMGTGVSIDSINGQPRFPEVFSRFTKRAGNTPSDCSQHLVRVRDCSKLTMVVVDDSSYESTNPEQIIERRLMTAVRLIDSKANPFHHCLNFDSFTGQYTWGDFGYATWFGFIRSMEAQERNLFGDHLKLQLEQEGYELKVLTLHIDKELAEDRKELDQRVKEQKVRAKELEYQLRRETPLVDDDEYKSLKLRRHLRIPDRRKVEKKYYAQTMGVQDIEELNDLLCQSDAKIDQRVGGLLLGMNSDSLLIKELSSRVDVNKQHIDKKADYERFQLAKELAKMVGVEIKDRVLVDTGVEINPDKMNMLYIYLKDKVNVTRRLFGLTVPTTSDTQKRNQAILKMLAKFGITTLRYSGVDQNGSSIKVRKIDIVQLKQVNKDIKQAKLHSNLTGYQAPKATGDLDTYTLYQKTKLGHLMPDVHNYLLSLDESIQTRVLKALNLKDFNILQSEMIQGEPQL